MDTQPGSPANPRVVFLKKCHLFGGLGDEDLERIASEMSVMRVSAGKLIIKQGSRGDNFYMIQSGSVQVSRLHKNREEKLARLVPGDYFGEEELVTHHSRIANVTTLESCSFLVLTKKQMDGLFAHIRKFKANVEVAVQSHHLNRATHFDWLQADEVIYFIARKHPILLWQAMLGPVMLFLGAAFLIWFALTSGSIILRWIAILLLIADILWGIWQAVDWSNDYFIVTNKRAIWLEKVIGVYDSRQEAPLSTVLSVSVETDVIGNLLDYGDVLVRTFVGRILFHHVHRPNQAASMVEEHWSRTKELSRKEDEHAIRQAIRQRMGLPEEKDGQAETSAPIKPVAFKMGPLQVMFSNIFKTRFEDSGTITYRKHWLVLLRQTWQPGLLLTLLLGALIFRLVTLPGRGSAGAGLDTLVLILLFASFIVFGWWLYQYVDWKNDIFQVTPDQILDVDKTPLGREERKAAPLDNILSTEYKRIGLMQVLFNYGNVYITVGGAQLIFEDVADPPAVQNDIDQRRVARIAKRKEVEKTAERDRLADWFAAYHQDSEAYPPPAGQSTPQDGDEIEVK